jgi:hypothetical protein
METLVALRRIDDPRKAVDLFRSFADHGSPIGWRLVEEIAGIHFGDALPDLQRHFAHRNDTGLATLFEMLAAKLTAGIVEEMTRPQDPLHPAEAKMCAYRITLLSLLSQTVRALHNREEAVVGIDGYVTLKQAA